MRTRIVSPRATFLATYTDTSKNQDRARKLQPSQGQGQHPRQAHLQAECEDLREVGSDDGQV